LLKISNVSQTVILPTSSDLSFFHFYYWCFPIAAGDINDKDQNIDPLLAKKVYKQKNVSEWCVCEKLDGDAQFGMVKNFIFAAAN